MNEALSGGGLFLLRTVLSLASFLFLLRFLLQAVRADFYNPLTQGVVRFTDPLLKPLRPLIPYLGGLDIAALGLTLLAELLLCMLTFGLPLGSALLVAAFRLPMRLLELYFWALLIVVILSWVAPMSRHPGAELLEQLTAPVLGPIRRVLPPAGGLDFSVLVLFLLLTLLRDYLVPGLALEVGIPRMLLP
jgi:YggT family protein